MSYDLLGAEGLADQYVTLRVVRIDQAKLREKIGGKSGWLASLGVGIADAVPGAAIDAALPVVVSRLHNDYGVDVEASRTTAPPHAGKHRRSEFWPGLIVGAGVGGGSLLIWKKLIAPLVARWFGGGAA